MVAEQAERPVGREPGPGMEQDVVADVRRVRQQRPDRRRRSGSDALVGVDVENPVAPRAIEGVIAGCGEVVRPGELVHPGAVCPRNVHGPIGRAGVDDDDLVDELVERREAGRQEALLVLDDQDSREQQIERTAAAPVLIT